jgi:hypothetical protein
LSTQVSPRTTPETQTWVALLRAHASSIRRFNAELVGEHGLTLNDYEVLLHLSRADGRRLRRVDLAERVLLTPSGITRLLEGLERSGYVDDGEAKLRAAAETHIAGIHAFFRERFSKDEVKALGGLLERLPLDPADDLNCAP